MAVGGVAADALSGDPIRVSDDPADDGLRVQRTEGSFPVGGG